MTLYVAEFIRLKQFGLLTFYGNMASDRNPADFSGLPPCCSLSRSHQENLIHACCGVRNAGLTSCRNDFRHIEHYDYEPAAACSSADELNETLCLYLRVGLSCSLPVAV